jgi:hypothetical protein
MNDVYFSSWVNDSILDEIRPLNVCRQFFIVEGKRNTKSYDWPKQADPGVAAAIVEATGLSNTALSSDKVTATADQVGIMATVTDFSTEISVIDEMEQFASVLGRSVAEKYETDMAALLGGFSNTTGSTGVDLTAKQFLQALSALEVRDTVGSVVAVLHPVQTGDLRGDIVPTFDAEGTTRTPRSGREYFTGGNDSSLVAPTYEGSVGSLYGTPIWHTSLVATANAGADRAGAVFVRNHCLGMYEIRPPRTELQRDASLPGTEIVVTANYGVVEIRDEFGQSIITDA